LGRTGALRPASVSTFESFKARSDFDPSGKKTVFDSLPKKIGKVNLVGRLDLNSEGLLLLTNKGYIKRYLELLKKKRKYLINLLR